jgi:hypothetical protein
VFILPYYCLKNQTLTNNPLYKKKIISSFIRLHQFMGAYLPCNSDAHIDQINWSSALGNDPHLFIHTLFFLIQKDLIKSLYNTGFPSCKVTGMARDIKNPSRAVLQQFSRTNNK